MMVSDGPGDPYNYAAFDGSPAQGDFGAFPGTPQVGARAPDAPLATLDGGNISLASLWSGSHVMLEFGSYT